MDDKTIIDLFFARDENAIAQTDKKYGSLLRYVALNILGSREDAEECVNDVLLALWNNIPPESPTDFSAYVGKAVRNRSLGLLRDRASQKRGGGVTVLGEEYLAMLADGSDPISDFEARRLGKVINEFLRHVGEDNKNVFVMRYYLGMNLEQITKKTGFSLGKVKMSLARTKKKLEAELRRRALRYEADKQRQNDSYGS